MSESYVDVKSKALDKSWAPCAHDGPGKQKANEFLAAVLDDPNFTHPGDRDLVEDTEHSVLESLLWKVGYTGYYSGGWPFEEVRFAFYADMWVGVAAEIVLDGKEETIWVEGDTFTLAVAKVVERLQARAEAYYTENPDKRTKIED